MYLQRKFSKFKIASKNLRLKELFDGGVMSINKDIVMQNVQRFGGAMFTPVIQFSFFGIMVSLSIIFKNPDIVGSIAVKDTFWYNVWYVIEQGSWTVFAQMPLLFAISRQRGYYTAWYRQEQRY